MHSITYAELSVSNSLTLAYYSEVLKANVSKLAT